ncbi:MAG: siderophore-iron reductase FhuF [Rhodobacteraceae bacterium]|nr:siderophore-iron reductase FhuF [Paracoccaceae bacterium]
MPASGKPINETIELGDLAQSLFHGPSAHLAQHFNIAPGSTEGICCASLKDPATLKGLLDQYASTLFDKDDFRSVVSYWSQWYFGFCLPPLFLLANVGDCEIPSDLSDLRVVLDDYGQPQRFILTTQNAQKLSCESTPFGQMERLFSEHLAPLVFSFSARTGVSAKVFWMNIAVILDYIQDVFLGQGPMNLKAVTESRTLPSGNRNPLYGPYRPASSEATRTRRVCCLRYALPNVTRCPDCALQPAHVGHRQRTVLGADKRTTRMNEEDLNTKNAD